ncbi:MAG: hypothetical protein WDN49_23270 [Acetobacteraceae bacterium]
MVTLDDGPDPAVTLATAPEAANGVPATLGTVEGLGSDPLTVTLTADSVLLGFGSKVTLSGDTLLYTPVVVTAAQSTTISYTVTDAITGATTSETQVVMLDDGPAPVVTLAAAPAADNLTKATLGTVAALNNHPLTVALTADAVLGPYSTLSLVNGNLIYTPGLLVTAADVGADTISYTVTDTVTGDVTTETQVVELSNGPAPVITLARLSIASDNVQAVLGGVTQVFSDPLSVTLLSDATFATGSTLTITGDPYTSHTLVYTPGAITDANAGTDILTYAVTDDVTGAVTTETQAVQLSAVSYTTLAPLTSDIHGVTNSRISGLTADAAGNFYAQAPRAVRMATARSSRLPRAAMLSPRSHHSTAPTGRSR